MLYGARKRSAQLQQVSHNKVSPSKKSLSVEIVTPDVSPHGDFITRWKKHLELLLTKIRATNTTFKSRLAD